jgi:hypothetical protein
MGQTLLVVVAAMGRVTNPSLKFDPWNHAEP